MKHLFMFAILTSFLSFSAFAVETTTDCPMMREATERNNPKANLSSVKSKPRTKSSASAQ